MATILTNPLTIGIISAIIDQDLQKMFNPQIVVAQNIQDKIKYEAEKISQDFVNLVNYHIRKVGTHSEDEYADNIVALFGTFKAKLKDTLNKNKSNLNISGSIGHIWVGIWAKLEFEAKEANDQLLEDVAKRAFNDTVDIVNAFNISLK